MENACGNKTANLCSLGSSSVAWVACKASSVLCISLFCQLSTYKFPAVGEEEGLLQLIWCSILCWEQPQSCPGKWNGDSKAHQEKPVPITTVKWWCVKQHLHLPITSPLQESGHLHLKTVTLDLSVNGIHRCREAVTSSKLFSVENATGATPLHVSCLVSYFWHPSFESSYIQKGFLQMHQATSVLCLWLVEYSCIL